MPTRSDLPLRNCFYPLPQNAPHMSARMNIVKFPQEQRSKAMEGSPWYGVYGGEAGVKATPFHAVEDCPKTYIPP